MAAPRKKIAAAFLVLAAGAVGFSGSAVVLMQARHRHRAAIERELANLARPRFRAQKVVYHVDYGAGWFERNYDFLLDVLASHETSVGTEKLHIVVILQGDGLDLLSQAKAKADLAARIGALKKHGVRFLVCKNSLIARAIDPFRDLYGVVPGDIVASAVAQLVALQQDGYIYLHL